MEAAGFAIGVAGLAGLFSTCLECYQLIQRGSAIDKDYTILATKFENQELRFSAWGRACGLFGHEEYDERLDDPELRLRIEATLRCIKSLFDDGAELNEQYGLRSATAESSIHRFPSHMITNAADQYLVSPTKWPLGTFFRRRKQRQKLDLLDKAQWAITDRNKFAELVQHLKDFNDDLDAMTRATGVPRRQRLIVEYEIEEVDDIEVLEAIALASEDESDVVSDTASIRLERIRDGSIRTVSYRTVTNSDGSASFVTARSSFSLSIDEVIAEGYNGSFVTASVSQMVETPTASLAPNLPQSLAKPGPSQDNVQKGSEEASKSVAKGASTVYRRKCVAVGDDGSHVTALLTCFTLGYLPTHHRPLDFKNFVTDCRIDGRAVELALWDLSGQQEYSQLRKPSYGDTDVILICYSAAMSLERARQSVRVWAEEAIDVCPVAPVIVVGISGPDDDSQNRSIRPDGTILSAAKEAGGIVVSHVVCRLLTGEGIDDVFELATRASLKYRMGKTVKLPKPVVSGAGRSSWTGGLFSGLRRILEEGDEEA